MIDKVFNEWHKRHRSIDRETARRVFDDARRIGRGQGVRAIENELREMLPADPVYMDPPDGGNVTVLEQVARMAEDAAKWRAATTRWPQGSTEIACSDCGLTKGESQHLFDLKTGAARDPVVEANRKLLLLDRSNVGIEKYGATLDDANLAAPCQGVSAKEYPWQAGGNSRKQDEAREYARAALATLSPLCGAQHAESGKEVAAKPPFPISDDEMAGLRRFLECATDGESYDVEKSMMQRLAEMGLVQRKSGAYYMATDFGLYVLDEYTIQRAAQLDGGQEGSAT